MTLLDLQSMETPTEELTEAALSPSGASLLLCGGHSVLSVTTCL